MLQRTILIGMTLLLASGPALAAPAFARRYATSCATCHQAFPRLNAVGESFRIMGFRFVDDELYRKVQPVELGDENYKKLWPEALWPTDLPRQVPLSFVNRHMIELDLDGSRSSNATFLLPEEVELVWVGNLGENMLFYGDIIYLQKDFGGGDPDSWATLKAWMQFQDLFGLAKRVNLRVGTVGTQTMGLFTARDANFYGTHFYLYTQWVVPPPRLADAGLSEFKGNNFTITPQAGIEVNGYGDRWFYAVGIVNGNPDVPASAAPASDISFFGMGRGSEDKDLYLHAAYKLGGLPFDRSGQQPEATLTTGAEFWRDDSLTFSLFAYTGTAGIRSVDLAGAVTEAEDEFWRLAAGVQKQIKDVSFSAAYMMGEDDDPYGALSDRSVDSRVWHVEALGFVYPWLIPYARYESLELDLPENVAGLDADQDLARVVAGAKFMIRPNVFFTLEGAHYTKGARLEEGFDQTLFMLLAISF